MQSSSSSVDAGEKKVRVVLIGLGRMGDMRLDEIARRDDCEVVGIVDQQEALTAKVGKKHRVPVYKTFKDVFQQGGPEFDAAWICTPTPFHMDIILTALRRKKHVAVEKPVCSDAEDIRVCYECAQANGVQLFCSFQRRFDPSYQRVSEIVKGGKMGEKLVTIHTVFRDYPCPPIEFLKKGGCPFHDLAVHDIDFIRSITNEDPAEIYATGSSIYPELAKLNIHDTASITMKYKSGLVCFLEFSRLSAYGYDQRCEIFGSNGTSARVDYPKQTSYTWANQKGHIEDVGSVSPIERFRTAYAEEIKCFIETCKGNFSKNKVQKKDAMMATLLSEAARQSAHYNRSIFLTYHENDVVHFNFHKATTKIKDTSTLLEAAPAAAKL